MFVTLFNSDFLLHSNNFLILDKHIKSVVWTIGIIWYIASPSAQVIRMHSQWPGNIKVRMFAKQSSHESSTIIYLAPCTMHSYWHVCQIHLSWECKRWVSSCDYLTCWQKLSLSPHPLSRAASAAVCSYRHLVTRKTTCRLLAVQYDWTCYVLQGCCTTAW